MAGYFLSSEFEAVNDFLKNEEKDKKMHWTGTGYAGTNWKVCDHEGLKVVYESQDGKKKLYAGNGRGVDETSGHWDLIIDLASQLPFEDPFGCIRQRSAKRFDVLRKYMLKPAKVESEILALGWPDMGTLPVTLDFWINLWKMLPEKTLAMCVGGHGRTGTCLVALMIADGIDYYTALEHVRTHHCDKAVETLAQTRYLHRLYMTMLERWIETEKDPKVLIDLKEDLEYSKLFVPNSYSDFGEKEPPKPPTPPHPVNGNGSASTRVWGDRLKLVGNQLYEQVCVDPVCKLGNCMIADHLGWIEYDVDAYGGVDAK